MNSDELSKPDGTYTMERLLVPLLRYWWVVTVGILIGLLAAAVAVLGTPAATPPSASVQALLPNGVFRQVTGHDMNADLVLLRSGTVEAIAEAETGAPVEIVADRVSDTNVFSLTVDTTGDNAVGAVEAVLDAFTVTRESVLRDILEDEREDVLAVLEQLPPPEGDSAAVVSPEADGEPTLAVGAAAAGDAALAYRRATLGQRLDGVELALSSLDGAQPITITTPGHGDESVSDGYPVIPVLVIGALGGGALGSFLAWSIPHLVAARRLLNRLREQD